MKRRRKRDILRDIDRKNRLLLSWFVLVLYNSMNGSKVIQPDASGKFHQKFTGKTFNIISA